MTGTGDPFARAPVRLERVTLLPLRKSSAALLGEALAGMEPWRTLGYSGKVLGTRLMAGDPALRRFEVRAGKELAGIICVRHPWLRGPYLELLAVLGNFQRTGIGNEVMEWFESGAKKCGSNNSWALVTAFNETARRFYRERGYVEIAPLKDLVKEGVDEMLLRKRFPG